MIGPSWVCRMRLCSISILSAIVLSGCGGGQEFHPVVGKITLDNEPLAEANISFVSEKDNGIRIVGATDSEGNYILRRSSKITGAPVGKYRVYISTFFEGIPECEPPIPPRLERVPAKYNRDTELVREIKPGENSFDFELDSDGEIFQPSTEK